MPLTDERRARSSPRKLLSVGQIASKLGVPFHRVRYVLDTRPYIQPAARCGIARVFDREAVKLIRHQLKGIEARRTEQLPDLPLFDEVTAGGDA